MADESVTPKQGHLQRLHVLKSKLGLNENWEYSDAFVPAKTGNTLECHTFEELVECLKSDDKIQIDARICSANAEVGKSRYMRLNREGLLEAVKHGNRSPKKLREATDCFASGDFDSFGSCVGGSDYLPLVGGPFYKQLYYYDYMRMHSASFYAYNHDPMARRVVQTMRDFTISLDWKIEFTGKNETQAQALWDAFVKVNELYRRMELMAQEFPIYGEQFVWWLPDNETKIAYRVRPGQEPSRGAIPRIRMVDPSVFWDIITYPEDIERVLYYQWIAPTQFQYYDAKDAGQSVGITKFIMQQIPADQIQHFKVNSVSNEKRGRSDLFPVLGYCKRLRDSVNYSIIALQKAAAWCIDTEIDGATEDLQAYVDSQKQIGTIPPAGSEFVHSDKVKRTYLGNQGQSSKGGGSQAFDWALSMIAAGTGIPLQYLGTHLSGAGTRASAVVATEPVAKLFETRRNVYRRVLEGMVERLWKQVGMAETPNYRIIFPELVAQDRSAKIKDLSLARAEGWVSKKRAAEIGAKELGILDYNFEQEQQQMADEQGGQTAPLTSPPKVVGNPEKPRLTAAPTAVDGEDRRALSKSRGF